MATRPDSRPTSAPGDSRNAHFAHAAAMAAHGFDVQRWIADADPIEEARGDVTKPMRHEDPDLDFYDD